MSEHTIVRRRIAALEEAIAIMEREWSETVGGGPISVYTDRCSVEVSKFDEDADEECWMCAGALVAAMRELLGDLTEMGRITEQFAMEHGAVGVELTHVVDLGPSLSGDAA